MALYWTFSRRLRNRVHFWKSPLGLTLPHCSLRFEEEKEDGVFSTEPTPVQRSWSSYQKTKRAGMSRLEIQLLCFEARRQRTTRVQLLFFCCELGGVSFGVKCGTDHLRVGYTCFFVYFLEVGEFGSYGDEEVYFILFFQSAHLGISLIDQRILSRG